MDAVVETPSQAIERAIGLLGSEAKLADACGCRQSYISKAKRTGRCSDKVAIRIHQATNGQVPASLLRPDLWARPEHVPVGEDASAA